MCNFYKTESGIVVPDYFDGKNWKTHQLLDKSLVLNTFLCASWSFLPRQIGIYLTYQGI